MHKLETTSGSDTGVRCGNSIVCFCRQTRRNITRSALGRASESLLRLHRFAALVISAAVLVIATGNVATASPDYHLRLNCGGTEVIDEDGSVWQSDKAFAVGGKPFSFPVEKDTKELEHPAPQDVYRSVRHQNHLFAFKDIPAGHYRVRLHLVDAFPGKERRMDFHAQKKIVLDDINPYEIAGKQVNRVVVREFPVVVEPGQGLIINCHMDRGDDVFEAALEVIASEPPPLPAFTAPAGEGAAEAMARGGIDGKILDVTSGRPVRLTWVQTDSPKDYMVSHGGEIKLLSYETTPQGGQERVLIDSTQPIQKPLLTHDASRVIFSDPSTNSCHAINWDGSELRSLGSGMAAEVWKDPSTGIEWVYVVESSPGSARNYVRRQLDEPTREESLWSGLPASKQIPWLQLSADGSRAAEAFPWPKCGVVQAAKPGFNWNLMGNGCWPGMAPDNSYRFFLFQGDHTTISMFEEGQRSNTAMAINTMPNLDGARVYHPRWSNDVRFLTVTGPQKSPKSELYIGRFSADFSHIEAWVQATVNDQADFYGDAWIGPEE